MICIKIIIIIIWYFYKKIRIFKFYIKFWKKKICETWKYTTSIFPKNVFSRIFILYNAVNNSFYFSTVNFFAKLQQELFLANKEESSLNTTVITFNSKKLLLKMLCKTKDVFSLKIGICVFYIISICLLRVKSLDDLYVYVWSVKKLISLQ